jgi:predicted dehydrogenase
VRNRRLGQVQQTKIIYWSSYLLGVTMDYTKAHVLFKIKKALRYIRLYGISRTMIKIQGQYHMKRKYDVLPVIDPQSTTTGHVGLLGCGNFAFSNIAYYLKKNYGKVIRGVMDVDIHHAASLCQHYGANYYTDDAEKVLQDPHIDTIYIASNHSSHAEYAIRALEEGKNVHIEKPHVVNFDQLQRLVKAMSASSGKLVSIGFNRPLSTIGTEIKRHLSSQPGAMMLNWFIAGHELESGHWYFQDSEGGRILGNLCHWTDLTYGFIDDGHRYPLTIIPARSEKSDCDIAVSYVFGDGSIAAITFSAKGHTFEGVREKLAAHRGDVLIAMDDFKRLVVEIVDKVHIRNPFFRDHGHERSVCSSYACSRDKNAPGLSPQYVWESAQLFLKTKEALDNNQKLVVESNEFPL